MSNPQGMSDLAIIGRNLYLPDKIDPNGTVNKDLRKGLKYVDLIPMRFRIDYASLYTPSSNNVLGPENLLIKLDPDEAMGLFEKTCGAYNLTRKKAIRLLINDETTMQESFTNTYNPNKLGEMINKIPEATSPLIQSASGSTLLNKAIGEGGSAVSAFLQDLLSKFPGTESASGMAKSGAGIAVNLFQGKRISLPDIWYKSDYSAGFSLSVKLISPYGSKHSIANYVIKPLMYLLILACPTTDDGLTSWLPNYVYVNAYGVANMFLAYIDNISIRRGGHDTSYNIYKQPLSIDVQISFKPALPGFATISGIQNIRPLTTFIDAMEPADESVPRTNVPGMVTLDNIINSLRPFNDTHAGDDLGNVILPTTLTNDTYKQSPNRGVGPAAAAGIGGLALGGPFAAVIAAIAAYFGTGGKLPGSTEPTTLNLPSFPAQNN
jgi:hypothetical protein